jgi:hypothetical protein
MSSLPSNPSPAFVRRNPHIYGNVAFKQPVLSGPVALEILESAKESKRIRQPKPVKLNATETRALEWLRGRYPGATIHVHAKIYVLALGVKYTPEFTAHVDGRETAWEVKGKHIWDDAVVKIKMAARVFNDTKWVLIWEDGGWMEQVVES